MTAYVSAFDLFSIGIGPSSSHTVGPLRAAAAFAARLDADGMLDRVDQVTCTLYGSLGSTGIGHGTPDAVIAGLAGLQPETCRPDDVHGAWSQLQPGASLLLAGRRSIPLSKDDIAFEPRTRLPGHPNALTLRAWGRDAAGERSPLPLLEETYYSIGGGFIRRDGEEAELAARNAHPLPYDSSEELLAICDRDGIPICEVARRNEVALHGEQATRERLDLIWEAMAECVARGLAGDGTLPGGLGVRRRAAAMREHLESVQDDPGRATSLEWLHAFALAVNEENASGGRVVTAPTNGAAGIVPAVAHYYLRFVPGSSLEGIRQYLLTATAIGSLFKANASISGAEGGCQAEVGSACAMAAGALCAVLGGTPRQVENAAEIAMEHHLGLTCDPVGGLVQIPCIERNAIASSTAVSAARLALHGDGRHLVSLDTVIETMRQTGLDMSTKYKETSEGGLAVNVIEC
ncbi:MULTISPECIES: L-serine ammonia-lyase [unclassified Leifsonia]|uniref:L-serine ammonia-lyase n=1 Tax=unclassified Leifsonia TaxID=2663824 RepID=UPI0008A7BA6B|nr:MULTISPECIES: L-serine ammonia-lyase [unclassified Leifsonia]SEI04403.1 L-serine dehydratase [Leifsonia sp. CL154]SFL74470.1 L-serine dehydratase [Leifsonia sp. CL147]